MNEKKKKWYLRIPNTYVILFIMILFATLLTWIVPAGEFDRVESGGRMLIKNGTYHAVDSSPVNLFDIFSSIPKGLQGSAQIIFMILLSSGAFGLINSTGAIENAIGVMIKKTQKANISGNALIFVITCLFSCLGIIIGPEIQIPFTLVAVSIALGLGYDLLTGVAMVIVGGGIGFSMGPINASVIGTADAISGLPLFSGMVLRTVIWAVTTLVGALLVLSYAKRVKKDPEYSYTKGISTDGLGLSKDITEYILGKTDKKVLAVFLVLFAFLIIGPTKFGWYLDEMSAAFVIAAIIVMIVAKLNVTQALETFMSSAGAMFGAAMLVGLGRTIQVIMENGHIMDTIIKAISDPIADFGPYVGAILMSLIHGIINFVIPSGSGQAAASMPIMFPVGQLIGMTDQTSVFAFQIGAGVMDLIYPTMGSMMAMLGLARVPYGKWVRFVIKVVAAMYLVTWVFLLIAVKINWGPF